MKNDKKVPFSAPLHEKDSDIETVGCRANNPDICSNNGLKAYVRLPRRMVFAEGHRVLGKNNIIN